MYACMYACMQLLLDHLKGLTKAFGFKVFALAASTSDLTCKSMSSVYGLRSPSQCFCLFHVLQHECSMFGSHPALKFPLWPKGRELGEILWAPPRPLTSPLARPASGLSGGSRGGGSMRMGHHGLRIGIRMWDSELKEQGLWVGNV